MMPTLPWTGASARTITIGSWTARARRSPCAASIPSSASRDDRVRVVDELLHPALSSSSRVTGCRDRDRTCARAGAGNRRRTRSDCADASLGRPARAGPGPTRAAIGRAVGSARCAALARDGLVRLERLVRCISTSCMSAGSRPSAGQALALPELAHLVHHLAPRRLGVARPDRLAEADLDLVAAGEEAAGIALRPVLAGRHRVVGAADVDRDDVDAVLRGDHRGAGADLADLAVARAGALGEHQQVPALVDQPVDVVGRAVAEPAAAAAERDGVEQQRDAVGLPALLVEVVGRGGDRGAVAPLARHRAQDRRRVEVARVVGDEDDRRASSVVEHLAPDDAACACRGRSSGRGRTRRSAARAARA